MYTLCILYVVSKMKISQMNSAIETVTVLFHRNSKGFNRFSLSINTKRIDFTAILKLNRDNIQNHHKNIDRHSRTSAINLNLAPAKTQIQPINWP